MRSGGSAEDDEIVLPLLNPCGFPALQHLGLRVVETATVHSGAAYNLH